MATRARWLIILSVLSISMMIGWNLLQPEIAPFQAGTLRIGVDATYPPFAYFDGDVLRGIDIEIGKALGQAIEIDVEFVPMGSDGLYDSLQSGNVDILISALQPESWRMGYARYTQPYFDAGLVLVSTSGFDDMRDISGKSLAYEFGSSADEEAVRWSRRIAPFETQAYELPHHALDAVRLGIADAALVDSISARLYLHEHPDWNGQFYHVTHVGYAIAVFIHRPHAYNAVQKALNDIMKRGIVDQIIESHL